MATLDNLTEADIKKVVNTKSLRRARSYVDGVRVAVRNGHTLRAEVGKSRYYNVEIDVLDSGIAAICSCPYTWGGYCKHVGAVLLKWVEQPGSFVVETTAVVQSDAIIETFTVNTPKTAVPVDKPRWLQQTHAAQVQNDDDNLRTWLGEYKVPELRQIARHNGWPLKGTRKDDLIQQIISHITRPGIALKSLLSLDTGHRQVLDALGLLYPGIHFQIEHVALLAKQWGNLTLHKKIETYISHLYDAGLVIPGDFDHHYWEKLSFIPPSVLRALPPLLADRIAATTLSDEANSGVMLGQARPFLQRVQQILLLLEQSQPPLRPPMPRPRLEKFHEFLREWDYIPTEVRDAQNKNQFNSRDSQLSLTVPLPQPALPDETIRRLAPIAGDETQLNFIYHLLLQAGLLQPGSPVTVWRESKQEFLRRDEAGQWAILARAYFGLATWSELWLMLAERPSIQLKRAQSRYYRPLSPDGMYQILGGMRGQLLQTLAHLPDGVWFSPQDIADLLSTLWPRFDGLAWVPQHYYGDGQPSWFLAEDSRRLDTANNKADWHKAQGAFIQHVIQGPLHWLGLADISVEYGRLTAFRLHGLGDLFFDKVDAVPLGGAALSKAATAVSAPSAAITVRDTTIIVDPTAVSAQAHSYLDGIALLVEAGTSRFIYQLSAAAIHQAFEDGLTFNEIHNGWEKWLGIPMPHAIENQLTAWHIAYGQVRLYEDVTVIEFGDTYALDEMKATTSLEKHLVAEISPTLVIITAKSVDLLVSELEKAGYTPKQTDKV